MNLGWGGAVGHIVVFGSREVLLMHEMKLLLFWRLFYGCMVCHVVQPPVPGKKGREREKSSA